MKQRENRKNNAISPKTVSETPQISRALGRLQQSKLRAAASALGDRILLEQHLPATARLLGGAADADLRQLQLIGALQRDRGDPPIMGVHLPSYGYMLLDDADAHAPVVARRILQQRIQERAQTVAALQAMLPQVRGEALRSLLQRIVAEDEEQLAALRATEQRLTNS